MKLNTPKLFALGTLAMLAGISQVTGQTRVPPHLSAFIAVAPNPAETIQGAANAVRDAKDEEAKAAATEKLDSLIGQLFDADVAAREQELSSIEQRLEKLRALLALRQEKRQEIIELQKAVVLNEAEGLGFTTGLPEGHGLTEPVEVRKLNQEYFRAVNPAAYLNQPQEAAPSAGEGAAVIIQPAE